MPVRRGHAAHPGWRCGSGPVPRLGRGVCSEPAFARRGYKLKPENEVEEVSDDIDDYWVMHVR